MMRVIRPTDLYGDWRTFAIKLVHIIKERAEGAKGSVITVKPFSLFQFRVPQVYTSVISAILYCLEIAGAPVKKIKEGKYQFAVEWLRRVDDKEILELLRKCEAASPYASRPKCHIENLPRKPRARRYEKLWKETEASLRGKCFMPVGLASIWGVTPAYANYAARSLASRGVLAKYGMLYCYQATPSTASEIIIIGNSTITPRRIAEVIKTYLNGAPVVAVPYIHIVRSVGLEAYKWIASRVIKIIVVDLAGDAIIKEKFHKKPHYKIAVIDVEKMRKALEKLW